MSNLISISELRADLPNFVKKVNKYDGRILITVGGKPKAVLLSLDDLESIQETAELLSIPGAKQSIQKGIEEAEAGKGTSFEKILQDETDFN